MATLKTNVTLILVITGSLKINKVYRHKEIIISLSQLSPRVQSLLKESQNALQPPLAPAPPLAGPTLTHRVLESGTGKRRPGGRWGEAETVLCYKHLRLVTSGDVTTPRGIFSFQIHYTNYISALG